VPPPFGRKGKFLLLPYNGQVSNDLTEFRIARVFFGLNCGAPILVEEKISSREKNIVCLISWPENLSSASLLNRQVSSIVKVFDSNFKRKPQVNVKIVNHLKFERIYPKSIRIRHLFSYILGE
jgi:hypothetical protein